jgi:hypothetical protein
MGGLGSKDFEICSKVGADGRGFEVDFGKLLRESFIFTL